MGSCLSIAMAPTICDEADGDEAAYHSSYVEDQVLGEGEFGVVKLVHCNKNASKQPFASKMLRKGVVFKDNTLYSPLKPEVLRGEIQMLRTLQGKNYCLKLESVFETNKCLYVITEYCAGGEMVPYIANLQEEMRSEDVSRIAFQMFSAVAHCSRHNIVHRDIKPENWMFTDPSPGAEGRLIDFGSGTIDEAPNQTHTTFAGSAFYLSPEMFQRQYTAATDVWSVGATLYVLVAGYPADHLQKAFNILQTAKNRNLRSLPNLPDNLPDSFYDLLDKSLIYRPKKRPSAQALLEHEFVTFHQDTGDLSLEDISAAAANVAATTTNKKNSSTNNSVSLAGSVVRHNLFLGFQQFERAVTTLLAAMLSKTELSQLLQVLQDKAHAAVEQAKQQKNSSSNNNNKHLNKTDSMEEEAEHQILSVVKVAELKSIVHGVLKNDPVYDALEKLPNAELYDNFAYHTALLSDFGRGDYIGNAASLSASLGRRKRRGGSAKLKRSSSFSRRLSGTARMTGSNRSTSSLGRRGGGSSRGRHSVHGTNVYDAGAAMNNNNSPPPVPVTASTVV